LFERLFGELEAKPAIRTRHKNDSTFDLHNPSFPTMNEMRA
jgi:hypothetical protein